MERKLIILEIKKMILINNKIETLTKSNKRNNNEAKIYQDSCINLFSTDEKEDLLDREKQGPNFGERDIYDRWKCHSFSTKFKVLLKLLTLNFTATSVVSKT